MVAYVSCTAVREGAATEWDFLYNYFIHDSHSSDVYKLLYALSCTRQTWLLQRLVTVNNILDLIFFIKMDNDNLY